MTDSEQTSSNRKGILDTIEWIGNKLPDPAMLFVVGALIVMIASQIAVWVSWEVQPRQLLPQTQEVVDEETGETVSEPVLDEDGKPVLELVAKGDPIQPRSLLSANGLYYALSSMVDNFMAFPPLGIVLVGVLGIGVAERTGFIGAALKAMMLAVPNRLLTPTMVFLGIMSSLGTDAGYVVLPPVAAALYKSVGRSPLAGIAAVFAGVSAGFNANLLVTSLDPLLAGLSTQAGQTIDGEYALSPAANWYFMIASTFFITAIGWWVSDVFVEKRLKNRSPEEGGPVEISDDLLKEQKLTSTEIKGLIVGVITLVVGMGIFVLATVVPDAPLNQGLGKMDSIGGLDRAGDYFDRWVESIVPMLFFLFLLPGLAYGIAIGKIRNSKSVAELMVDTIAYMAPIIVLAFFAAQFIQYFKFSKLDQMLAHTGGQFLAEAGLGATTLMIAFILITAVFNLFIGSMSAKYAMFAPIFVPMFMLVGISPALTQVSYRIGDSVSNVITPLNAYLVIILVVMQKFAPRAGMGTLIAMMMPYTIIFLLAWIVLLIIWIQLGIPLGPGGPLSYAPGAE